MSGTFLRQTLCEARLTLEYQNSLAVSVKMSVLLYMPALMIILLQHRGAAQTFSNVALMSIFQLILGWPFLSTFPKAYLTGAFDLSRVFLFKWTVNWRFLGEELFLNQSLANALLLGHACTLLLFAHFKWCKDEGGIFGMIKRTVMAPLKPVGVKAMSSDCELLFSAVRHCQ